MLSPTEKSPGKHRKTRNVINLVFIVVAIVAMAGIALSPSAGLVRCGFGSRSHQND